MAHLVQAGGVPRLSDQRRLPQDRILGDLFDDGRVRQHRAVLATTQDGGEIEAKAVDVHLRHPIAEDVDDQLPHPGVVAIQRVPAAGVIAVGACVGVDQVVDRIVDAAERMRRPPLVPLRCVIQHDVQDDRDAGAVKAFDHLLELAERLATARSGGIGGVGGEEGDRVVAPVVQEALPGEGVHAIAIGLLERPHRHELDRVDAERLQVGDLLDEPGERAGPGDAGGRMLGEAAHVQFVNDRVAGTETVRLLVTPVEGVVDD